MATVHLGLSGYAYKPWQGEGRFYPPELKAKEFFDYYAERFDTVEMDGTWYRMPSENAVEGWIAQAPPGFKYTFKVHRQVSHMSRLTETGIDPMQFFVKRLNPALEANVVGCIYIQLPPNLKRTDNRLEKFLPHLPPGPCYGIEFRHDSWNTDEVEAILREHNVAFVASDMDELKGVRRDTGSVVYSRLRRELYTDDDLKLWTDYFSGHAEAGKEVYVMFKHEDDGSPWVEAERMRKMLAQR
jgi:uncharacterized protein YecE (DUF72 family)